LRDDGGTEAAESDLKNVPTVASRSISTAPEAHLADGHGAVAVMAPGARPA
jgi:hypothetical protein